MLGAFTLVTIFGLAAGAQHVQGKQIISQSCMSYLCLHHCVQVFRCVSVHALQLHMAVVCPNSQSGYIALCCSQFKHCKKYKQAHFLCFFCIQLVQDIYIYRCVFV